MKRKILRQFNCIDDIYDDVSISVYCYYFNIYFVQRNQNNHWSPTYIERRTIKSEIIKHSTQIVYDQLTHYFKQPQLIEFFKWHEVYTMNKRHGYYWSSYWKTNTAKLLRIEFTTQDILDIRAKRKILKSIKPKLNKFYKHYGHKLISSKYKKSVLYKIADKESNNILYL